MTRLFFVLFSIISALSVYGQDTFTIPIKVACAVEADLRRLDQYAKLDSEQTALIAQQAREIILKDSIAEAFRETDSLQLAHVQIQCVGKVDSEKAVTIVEKDKRKRNGLWRDVFMGTTALLLWVMIKPN